MDMALQAYQLAVDSPKKADEKKTYSVPSKKDFGEYLENTKNIMEEPLTKNKAQDNDILLMQLLNILNMNISFQDFKTIVSYQLSDIHTDLQNIDFIMKLSAEELIQCWQKILSEYNISGNINQDTVKMFYLAMKKAVPDISDIDLKVLHNQINEMLESSNSDKGRTQGTQILKNITKEHGSATLKAAPQDGIANDGLEKSKIKYSEQSREVDSYADVISNDNKKAIAENQTVYSELQDRWTENVDDSISTSQYRDVSPFSMKESFSIPSDRVGSNMITFSAGNVHTPDIFEQLVDRMHLAFKGDVQQVSIRLKPDYLGNVLIKVFADKDKLKAELFVDNTQVRTMLKVHALDFQNQIREQGYNISEINVYKMSDGLEMGAFNQQSSSNNHYQARRSRIGFNKQATEKSEIFAKDYYDLWGNTSNVNYMA